MKDRTRVKEFRRLHRADEDLLILVNVWDAASAHIVAEAGAKSIATSSASLCWAHGFPDGAQFPKEALLPAIGEIAGATALPITVDLEAGYSDDPERVAELALEISNLGVAGINLEDGAGDPEILARKIQKIRQKVDLFINARCDLFLWSSDPDDGLLEETIRRGRIYQEAGAEAFFVPRLIEPEQMSRLAGEVKLPLNVLAFPNLPPLEVLRLHGVRRLSLGAVPYEKILGELRQQTRIALTHGHTPDLFTGAIPYPEINALIETSRRGQATLNG